MTLPLRRGLFVLRTKQTAALCETEELLQRYLCAAMSMSPGARCAKSRGQNHV